jgi:hypothetical protein
LQFNNITVIPIKGCWHPAKVELVSPKGAFIETNKNAEASYSFIIWWEGTPWVYLRNSDTSEFSEEYMEKIRKSLNGKKIKWVEFPLINPARTQTSRYHFDLEDVFKLLSYLKQNDLLVEDPSIIFTHRNPDWEKDEANYQRVETSIKGILPKAKVIFP